jgi:hypothetical protein
MSVKQISVFIENRPGTLMELSKALSDRGIDMRAFSLAEANDFGLARIIVRDVEEATEVLKEAGYVSSLSEVVAVAVPDVSGGLFRILSYITEANVNVEYLYCFLGGRSGKAYVICKVSDIPAAEASLKKHGARLATQSELSQL